MTNRVFDPSRFDRRYRLSSEDNWSLRAIPDNDEFSGVRGSDASVQRNNSPQFITSNRQRIEPGRPIVYISENQLTNESRASTARANSQGPIGHTRLRSIDSVSCFMVGDNSSLNPSHADEHDRRESNIAAQETRQAEGGQTFPNHYVLHGNGRQRNENMEGVECTNIRTGHRADHSGYPQLAPRPTINRRHEHNSGFSGHINDRQDNQDRRHLTPDHGHHHNGGFSSFISASTNPAIRVSSFGIHNQLSHAADVHRSGIPGSMALATSLRSLGETGLGMQHRPTNPHMQASEVNRRPVFDQEHRGRYPLGTRGPRYNHSRLATESDAHTYPARSTTDRDATSLLRCSSWVANTTPSTTHGIHGSPSPEIKQSPVTSVSSLSSEGFDPALYSKTLLNAQGGPLYIARGVDPLAFRPQSLVPHTDELVVDSIRGGQPMPINTANVHNLLPKPPMQWLDQPGGPRRPSTTIGDPDHIVGWNGTKLPQLQPGPLSMPDSKLGPRPGVEWSKINSYDLFPRHAIDVLKRRRLLERSSAPLL